MNVTTAVATAIGGTIHPSAPLSPGEPAIDRISFTLPLWPEVVTDWRISYGKSANLVLGPDGSFSCAEVEIVRRLRDVGWNARWIDNFGAAPKVWRWAAGRDADLPEVAGGRHLAIKHIVRSRLGKTGGCWDVIGWRGPDLVYIESKGPGDSVKPTQRAWHSAGAAVDPDVAWIIASWTAQ